MSLVPQIIICNKPFLLFCINGLSCKKKNKISYKYKYVNFTDDKKKVYEFYNFLLIDFLYQIQYFIWFIVKTLYINNNGTMVFY